MMVYDGMVWYLIVVASLVFLQTVDPSLGRLGPLTHPDITSYIIAGCGYFDMFKSPTLEYDPVPISKIGIN